LLERHVEFGPEHPDLDWKGLVEIGSELLSQGVDVKATHVWSLAGRLVPDLLFRLDSIRHWRIEGE
jgi:uncharacterized protein with HEPN domain